MPPASSDAFHVSSGPLQDGERAIAQEILGLLLAHELLEALDAARDSSTSLARWASLHAAS